MPANEFENIYYLGPDGSNAHCAAIEFLRRSNVKIKNKLPQKTIRKTLERLSCDEYSIGVLPIENSIEGIVRETIDNIQKLPNKSVVIQSEITIPIKHCLLSKSHDKNGIKTIISHPQALAQCGNHIYKNFPEAELKEVSSTSFAAQKTAFENDIGLAAIANPVCASLFNLNILEENINDEKDNKTRFYILGREKLTNDTKGKTAVLLATKNEPGALCEVLKIFEKHNINLTYIGSRPEKSHLGKYLFFIELDGLYDNGKIEFAIDELIKHVEFFKYLGSFNIL